MIYIIGRVVMQSCVALLKSGNLME